MIRTMSKELGKTQAPFLVRGNVQDEDFRCAVNHGRKKILMVLNSTSRGGAEAFVLNVCRSIDREKYQIDIAITENRLGGFDKDFEAAGCRIFSLERFRILNYFAYVRCWNKFLATYHYDIIHGNVTSPAVIYLRIAHKYGCATILHSHSAGYRGGGMTQSVKKIFTKKAYKHADLWFACGEEAAQRVYGDRYKNCSRYYFIPNAIDVKRYRFDANVRKQIRDKYALGQESFVIGHVGSFTTPKNHKFLLQVFAELKKHRPQSKLLLVGDGRLRDEIESQIDALNIKNDVVLSGSVSNVNEVLMSMDVMVFPSLFEGLPVSLVEAQASGLPVFMSDSITQDVVITNLIRRISLESSISVWCDEILSEKINPDRADFNDAVGSTSFNIKQCISLLEECYADLCH